MKTPPTTLDPMSTGLQHDTTTIQLIPLSDNYNPYYSDPDYGSTPIGTLIATTNIIYTSTVILINLATI